jgi:phenylacetate-CoA ligase
MRPYWEEELETLPRKKLEELQAEKLRDTIARAMQSEHYKKLYESKGISPGSIKGIEDIQKLPFTTKQDLRDNFPYGLLATPKKDCVRLHSSSGTTGTPTVIFHNQHDLDSWANLVARSLYSTGIRDTDVFQNMSG